MKMPSVMKGGHAFSTVPRAEIERSQFDRSHALKTAFDEAYLIPVYVDEALPGDTFHLRMNGFVRLGPVIKPIMDNLYLDSFFFAVPYRLVWANFAKMMGEQTNPGDSISYGVPVFAGHQPAVGSLSDYMGLPVTPGANIQYSSLWHRAYNLIYNQWFRDENLINSAVTSTADSSSDDIANYVLRKRGKRHDYFTSCLPWPQKGTAVSLPLGTVAPVLANGVVGPSFKKDEAGTGGVSHFQAGAGGTEVAVNVEGPVTWADNQDLLWADPGLYANLASATAATINQLRQAFQIQKLMERDARGGTRYTEIIKSHFGVTSPDARLQRPEYLGGGTCAIMVSPVAQTQAIQRKDDGTAITGATPQANLSGIGTGTFMGHGFVKSFTEHCLLLGLVSVRADLTYQQGMDKMWKRSTRYEFYWPALAHIGEQSVLNQEIYCKGDANDALTFGYQERYAEYRYKPSKITGKYRSGVSGTLDIWHLAQEFGSLPSLNQTFIEEAPPLTRVLAVPSEPHFLADFWFDLKCARPMPMFSVPGLIDHF